MSEWQPIETAPKDANNYLLWWPFQRNQALIGGRNYRSNDDGTAFIYPDSWWCEWDSMTEDATDPGPTHWMMLPDPPK